MNRLRAVPFRIKDKGWLLFVVCLLIGIRLAGWRLGLAAGSLLVASMLLHEVGHMLAAIWLGVPVREFGLCFGGAYTRRAYAESRRDEVLISAAGPLMNLLLVFPLTLIPVIGFQLAVCNVALGVGNLMPFPSSDGLRILRTLWSEGRPGGVIPALTQPVIR